MRAWHRRAIQNGVKALLPGKYLLRRAKRRIRPYQTNPGMDQNLFGNAVRQVELLRDAGVDVRGRRVLEIGSGWHPILPMTLLAAGAKSVTLTDVERLLDPRLVRSAIDFVLARADVLSERIGANAFDRLRVHDGDVSDMLRQLGLTYIVPYRTEMSADQSADLIVSCSVLEHIGATSLSVMMKDFARILAPGGAMIHFVDCSDHYAMTDKSISRCNFLQYEDRLWRFCSLNEHQNRLRHSDYLAMVRQSGFNVLFEWRESREQEQREVAEMRLARRFIGRDLEDLAAISTHLVAVRA